MIYVKLMGRGDVNVTDVQTSSYNFKGFEGKIFAFCNGYFDCYLGRLQLRL